MRVEAAFPGNGSRKVNVAMHATQNANESKRRAIISAAPRLLAHPRRALLGSPAESSESEWDPSNRKSAPHRRLELRAAADSARGRNPQSRSRQYPARRR